MHLKILCLLASIWSFLFVDAANAQSLFGRYTGTLKHSGIAQDQLAKLDFIVAKQNANEFKLIGILSLYFGDYKSHEYVTYHFDSVTYNVVTGALVFDQPDQGITVVSETFNKGVFSGKLRSAVAGDVGVLDLKQMNSVMPSRSLVQPLWGEYRGTCDGAYTALQIQTKRASGDSAEMSNPFGTYEIAAQLADISPESCLEESQLCVVQTYDTGSYNFFNGKLDLIGRARSLKCSVTALGLECDQQCTFRRTSNEAADLGEKSYPRFSNGTFAEPTDQPTVRAGLPLSGAYYGYLFHERLGIYQPIGLNILGFQATGVAGTPVLTLSAVSSMYFGGFDSPEHITHRFNQKEFPILSPQIVLERIDGGTDVIIQLTRLGDGKAQGVWYSTLFGRVGTFELLQNVRPNPPQGATVLGPIGGKYEGGGWNIDLTVVRQPAPSYSVNPFFPLSFSGAFRLRDISANVRITGGTYDFYTGKLSFNLEDDSFFAGYRSSSNQIFLKRPTPGVTRPLLPHRYQSYLKVK